MCQKLRVVYQSDECWGTKFNGVSAFKKRVVYVAVRKFMSYAGLISLSDEKNFCVSSYQLTAFHVKETVLLASDVFFCSGKSVTLHGK